MQVKDDPMGCIHFRTVRNVWAGALGELCEARASNIHKYPSKPLQVLCSYTFVIFHVPS